MRLGRPAAQYAWRFLWQRSSLSSGLDENGLKIVCFAFGLKRATCATGRPERPFEKPGSKCISKEPPLGRRGYVEEIYSSVRT